MTPVERLTAAIEKLEKYRSYPVPPMVGAAIIDWAKRGHDDAQAAHLITVLSGEKAIDAQLAILNDGIAAIQAWTDPNSEAGWEPQDGEAPPNAGATYLALADAILGDQS